MKNWLNRIFSTEERSAHAGGGSAAPAQAPVEQTIPADAERTVAASPSNGPQAIQAAEAQVAAEWKVGDVVLDLYEVKQIHEGGGMGLVYRVHHRGWNIDLAVKSPRKDNFRTQAQKENFVRECETWINLGLHPHIVSCYYVRTLGGIPRVFAEYVESGSLKDWIDNRKLYEGGPQEALKRIIDIAIQAAWGLQYAHEQGLIHQDMKPANVLMIPDGTAKITDFGLARARAAAGESVVAGAGSSILVSVVGMTPAYCSPEQANNQPLSRKTDIWSWAVSVLEMLVGEVSWSSGTAVPELFKHLSEVGFEGAPVPEPPQGLVKLLHQCLIAEPRARPENFVAVTDTLKSIYCTLAGEDYARGFSEAAEIQADTLNNRAVSMLDLGRADESEMLFEQALTMDPGHPQATYNRGLLLWRNARGTDYTIVKALEQSDATWPGDWNVKYLLGLIHLERLDLDGAVAALTVAEKLRGGAVIQRARAEVRGLETAAVKCLKTWDSNMKCLKPWDGDGRAMAPVALSADGRWALSGAWDKTLRLFEVSGGNCLRTFEGHTDAVTSVALSADGRWALSGSRDRTLRLWEVSSGNCLGTFVGHTRCVTSVALNSDGCWALSGSEDQALRLWKVSDGNCLRTFVGHTDHVTSVALSADGRWAVSGSDDQTLRLWDVSSGNCLRTFEGHTGWVNSVALSTNGLWALSGSDDQTLRLWEVSSGERLRTFEGHGGRVTSVALSADASWALSGSCDQTVRLWEVSSGKCLRTLEADTPQVTSVALSADRRWVWSGRGWGEGLRLWDVSGLMDGRQIPRAPMAVCRLARAEEALVIQKRYNSLVSAAGKHLTEGKFARAWILAVECTGLAGHRLSSQALDIAHQAGLRGKRKRLRKGWCWRTFAGHTDDVTSVALSADGRGALSGSWDNTLRLWEVSSGKCLRTFVGHTRCVTSVALSADGRWALSGSWDWTLRLWEVRSGECVRILEGHTDEVTSVALSSDTRLAVSGSSDGMLGLWEVSSGQCLKTLEGNSHHVRSVALSLDGRLVLSGSWDKTLRLWEVSSGNCLKTFVGHTGAVTSVALSADGRWALSGSEDQTLRLWEVISGKCLRILDGHTNSVESIALSGDGRWALSGSSDRTLRLWELEWNYEFPGDMDWDVGAQTYLDAFVSGRQPYSAARKQVFGRLLSLLQKPGNRLVEVLKHRADTQMNGGRADSLGAKSLIL